MKKYTADQLRAFVDRAYTPERIIIARDYISKLSYISKDLRYELMADLRNMEIEVSHRFYCTSSYEGDYSASSPWNAPGMSAKDFI